MFDGRRAASGAVALPPTCYAGLNVMAKSIVAQKSFKITVVGVRTRPNQRHVASHNIPKLRQFVDTGGPKQPFNGCYSRVVTRRLDNVGTVLLDGHGPKFQYDEMFTVKPLSDCRKITGPGLSSLMAMAARAMMGGKNTSTSEAAATSMMRFT